MEIYRRIRQFSKLPIIMVTAKKEITDRVMGLDLGADDYIIKPFAIKELLARMRVLRRENKKVYSKGIGVPSDETQNIFYT